MRLSHVKGFTLVEVAIALVVVGLLIAGGMNLMTASSESSRYKSTQTSLNEIKQSLQGYYVINQRLPCPDTDLPNTAGFGEENVTAGVCDATRGWLPHLTLGAGGNGDAWGERFKYVVSGDNSNFFTTKTTNCTYTRPTSASPTTVRVQDLTTSGAANYLSDFNAFVVLSTGKNGRQTNTGMTGAFSNNGGCSSLNALEQENCDDDSVLRYGTNMSDGSSLVFDDLLVWIGDMPLLHQLIKNGCGAITNGSGSGSEGENNLNNPTYDPTQRTTYTFTANDGQQFDSDVNRDEAQRLASSVSNGDDKVIIDRDLNRDVNLMNGNNSLSIGRDSNGEITAGDGNDIIRINKDQNRSVSLGNGNNYLEVRGDSNGVINAGSGNDSVRIEKTANKDIDLGAGNNSIYLNDFNSSIKATGGKLTVYYNKSSIESWRANRIQSGATLLCNVNNSWSPCTYR